MTKEQFKELASVHMYGKRSNGMIAIYFDWKQGVTIDGKYFCGFKYCIFGRQDNVTQAKLIKLFYELIVDFNDDNLPYYLTFIKASNDINRFKVPISSNGLNRLYKHNEVITS